MQPKKKGIDAKNYLLELLAKTSLENVFSTIDQFYQDNAHITKDGTVVIRQSQYHDLRRKEVGGHIDKEDISREKREITNALFSWIIDTQDLNESWYNPDILSDEEINLSLEDLKAQLKEMLDLNGQEVIFFLLDRLIASRRSREEFHRLQEENDFLEWSTNNYRTRQPKRGMNSEFSDNSTTHSEEEQRKIITQKRACILKKTRLLIDNLATENLTINWRLKFTEDSKRIVYNRENKPRKILISSLDIVKIPEYLVDPGDFQNYKRLMIQAQDAYFADDFEEAYRLCLKVRNEVDPESPQLYEYLFVTYFNMVGTDTIIDSTLAHEGTERHLKKLFLYAGRFHRLQGVTDRGEEHLNAEADQNKLKSNNKGANKIATARGEIFSYTGQHNIEEVKRELLLALADRYTNIAKKISKGVSSVGDKQKQEIIKCIAVARNITEHIGVDAVFASTVINELAGGGKNQWIAIDAHGALCNTEPGFDAITNFDTAVRLLSYDREKEEEKIKEKLARDLFHLLNTRYNRIRSEFFKQQDEQKTRKKLIELLVNLRVATHLFPRFEQFSQIGIRELGSEGTIWWFELSFNRVLRSLSSVGYPYYFDAEEFYRYFLFTETDQTWEEEKERLINTLYGQMVEALEKQQVNIRNKRIIGEGIFDPNFLNTVVACYRNWQICYDVKSDPKFLQYAFEELAGSNGFFWFVLDTGGFKKLEICQELTSSFDPSLELSKLINGRQFVSKITTRNTLAINYLNSWIIPRIGEIRFQVQGKTNPSIEFKREFFNLMKQVIILCKNSTPQPEFGDFLYDELLLEITFPWLDLKHGEFISLDENKTHMFDPVILLRQAMRYFKNQERFTLKAVKNQIVNKRMLKIEKTYEEDFSRYRMHNDNPEDILKMIGLIEKLVGYYKMVGKKRCLEIPYKELVNGEGRIYWSRKNRLYIYDIWKLKWGMERIYPRWKIRMISDFDYTMTRLFVKKAYEHSATKTHNEPVHA